jgi:hypothetical protein
LEQLRWRCSFCHRSCSCTLCLDDTTARSGQHATCHLCQALSGTSPPLTVGDGQLQGRNLYEVVEEMVIPECQDTQTSYVELLRRRTATSYGRLINDLEGVRPQTFVSHWWGEEFRKFIRTLATFAQLRSKRVPWRACMAHLTKPCKSGPKAEMWSFWICAFANNQFAIEHALGDTRQGVTPRTAVMDSAFATALRHVDDVVAVLDKEGKVYTRIWCCFELFSVVQLLPARCEGHHLEVFIANETGVVSSGCGENIRATRKIIDNIETSTAQASKEEDKMMIEHAMLAESTSYDDLDKVLQRLARVGSRSAAHRRCIEIVGVLLLTVIGLSSIYKMLMLKKLDLHISLMDVKKAMRESIQSTLIILVAWGFILLLRTLWFCKAKTGYERRIKRVEWKLVEFTVILILILLVMCLFSALAGSYWGVVMSVFSFSLELLIICCRRSVRAFLDPLFI